MGRIGLDGIGCKWRSKQKKNVFLQSWCALTFLWLFEETLGEANPEKVFFYHLGVSLPYFWVLNEYVQENTKSTTLFWAWAYLSFVFLFNSVQRRKTVFFYYLGVSLVYFWFLNEYVQEHTKAIACFFGLSIPFFSFLIQ